MLRLVRISEREHRHLEDREEEVGFFNVDTVAIEGNVLLFIQEVLVAGTHVCLAVTARCKQRH